MPDKNHIKAGDEIVVNNSGYIVDIIDQNGYIFAIGNNGEEWEGDADLVDAHFPLEEKWETFK